VQNHLDFFTDQVFPDLSTAAHEAFTSLVADISLFALPFASIDNTLQTLPLVQSKDSTTSFQNELNKLDAVLDPRTPLYLILRRKGSLVAVTFVPYLAKDTQRNFFLENRLEFVRQLGEEHFSQLLICKEIGEITDARSWIEREETGNLPDSASKNTKDTVTCDEEGCAECAMKDVGYKRNKCRLCDRRMKNKISPEALEAFKLLTSPGATIQIVS
jgi:twinfilin-like protein